MTSKIVAYDLADASSYDYKHLFKLLESYPKYGRLTESCWAIQNNETCEETYEKIVRTIDKGDRLFVGELSAARWKNIICED